MTFRRRIGRPALLGREELALPGRDADAPARDRPESGKSSTTLVTTPWTSCSTSFPNAASSSRACTDPTLLPTPLLGRLAIERLDWLEVGREAPPECMPEASSPLPPISTPSPSTPPKFWPTAITARRRAAAFPKSAPLTSSAAVPSSLSPLSAFRAPRSPVFPGPRTPLSSPTSLSSFSATASSPNPFVSASGAESAESPAASEPVSKRR